MSPTVSFSFLPVATFYVCADGGANRLHDELPRMIPSQPANIVRRRFLPQLIRGDMDSVRPEVLEFYKSQGVCIENLSHDQMSTDLHKCLAYILASGQMIDTVVAVGALGGRLDHILSNLSTLHQFRNVRIVLCGDGNLTRLVPAGKSIIRPNRVVEGPTCGLIPLVGPARASTQGLKWNLNDTEMRIGELVSTSNVIQDDEISVDSDVDLIWTTEFKM